MKKYTKAVSATLAGALAVGMVPAMALADDSVELLAQDTVVDNIAGGTLVLTAGQTAGQTFAYNPTNQGYLIPTDIAPQYETDVNNYVEAKEVCYVKLSSTNNLAAWWNGFTVNGEQVKGSKAIRTAPTEAGEWAVFAGDGNDNWCKQGIAFTIAEQTYTDVEIYEVAPAGTPAAEVLLDETFTFTGSKYTFGSAAGNLALKTSTGALSGYDEFTIVDPATNLPTDALYAGDYKVIAKDVQGNLGDLELDFTIDAYDVNNPLVTIADTDNGSYSISGIPSALAGYYTITGIDKTLVASSDKDYYTATIGLDQAAVQAAGAGVAKSVTGTKSVTFAYVENALQPSEITVSYTGGWPTKIDYSVKGTKAFNEDLVTVKIGSTVLEKGEYTLSVVEYVNGKPVPAEVSDLANAGIYEVSVVLNAKELDWKYAGTSAAQDVVVTNGTINTADIAYVYDGSPVYGSSDEVTYDGTDYMSKLAINVKDSTGKAVAAEDYTVTIKKIEDAAGKTVSETATGIVDAGVYEIVVTSTEYQIDNNADKLVVTVKKAGVAPEIDADYLNADKQSTFLWTGKDIVVPLIYDDDAKAATPKVAVPEGSCKVEIVSYTDDKGVKAKYAPAAINAAGTYVINIKDANPADNYDVTTRTGWTVVVDDTNVFVDVASNAWYADEVYTIAKAGIMGGYGNGKFGPSDDAERQDVALMMFRMLTGKSDVTNAEDWANSTTGAEIILPFSDVNAKAYYAQAVWYVNKNGIMTGYADGSDEFGVGDAITREQVATILYRTDAAGLFKPVTLLDSALDAYVDANEISGYAVEAMEWAVAEGIFGVSTSYLNPGDPISRAELAAVFVRFMGL